MPLAVFLSAYTGRVVSWLALGAAAGVYFFCKGFLLLRRKRLILNTPSSKVRSASLGLVEVSGIAVGPYTMPAALSCKPCYYYKTIVWKLKQSGKSRSWEKVAEESLHVPFYVDDGTGRLLVNPAGAEVDLHCDMKEEYGDSLFSTGASMPLTVSGFLARHGIAGDEHVKVEEYCVKPHNPLFVLGTLAENIAGDTPRGISPEAAEAMYSLPGAEISRLLDSVGQPSTAAPQVVRLSSGHAPSQSSDMTSQQRIVAAMLKAGITSPAAWAVASDLPHSSPAAAAPAADPEFDLHPKTVLMQGKNDSTFYISWRSQREIIAGLGWRSALMIWGGPVLTLTCLYLLAADFGWL